MHECFERWSNLVVHVLLLVLSASKLIQLDVPGVIDSRVVQFKKPSEKEIISNLNLLLNATAILGCDINCINVQDFINNKVCIYL